MFSIETRLEGMLLSFIQVYNESPVDDNDNYRYSVKYYDFGEKDFRTEFEIVHSENETMEKFLLKIYEEINKKIKEKNEFPISD